MAIDKYSFIDEELERRRHLSHLRGLRTVIPLSGVETFVGGSRKINFCSNDYLGLSKHPYLKEKAVEYTERYGAGSTASRLICGTYDCFQRVEEKLAHLKGTECALIFNSGFQANVSLLPALTDKRSLILSDSLNHNSLIQGSRLSRCRVVRFRHNDISHLRHLLRENLDGGFSCKLIVTESIFSVDGDRSSLGALADLADEYQALLIVDDAHATGVLGKKGMGLTCGLPVDLTMGTFGKACGSFGAYVTCSRKLRDYLVNCCSGFIYTTALPPAVVGMIEAALELVPGMDKEREELLNKADYLRTALRKMGWDTGDSSTQIIPVIVGDGKDALELSRWLEKNGVLAVALRPPTVPEGGARIRVAVTALHTGEQLEHLIHLFKGWR